MNPKIFRFPYSLELVFASIILRLIQIIKYEIKIIYEVIRKWVIDADEVARKNNHSQASNFLEFDNNKTLIILMLYFNMLFVWQANSFFENLQNVQYLFKDPKRKFFRTIRKIFIILYDINSKFSRAFITWSFNTDERLCPELWFLSQKSKG